MRPASRSITTRTALAGAMRFAGAVVAAHVGAGAAWSQGLPLPPGEVVTGTVFKPPFLCPPASVPSIANGADANAFILPSSCVAVPSFVATAPAAMVVTSSPTQYVRLYCPEPQCSPVSAPNRPFMADPGTIRGRTAAQIQDVLALPGVPSAIAIVTVPAGSCVLVGIGAPAFGGTGGTAQEWAAGTPSGPNCQGLQYLPASNYIVRQEIGAFALLYGPRAGGGNAGAVAAALDQGPFPAPFTEMDGIYKSIDLLNFGEPGPLRAALADLGGEVHADYPTVAIRASQMFLGAVRAQMRAGDRSRGSTRAWLGLFGGAGRLSGDVDRSNLDMAIGGIAGGIERRFDPALLAGLAFGWAGGHFGTNRASGNGTTNTFAIGPYVRYSPGRWHVEGSIGYAHSRAEISRTLHFVNYDLFHAGVTFMPTGRPRSNALLAQAEVGYRAALGPRTDLTPFAAGQAVAIRQRSFDERGGGAVNLHVSRRSAETLLGIVGAEVSHSVPSGESVAGAPFRLSGRIGWAHDFADTARLSTAWIDGTLSAAPFTVRGASAVRDRLLFGVGLAQSLPRFDLVVRYEGMTGTRTIEQAATVAARLDF